MIPLPHHSFRYSFPHANANLSSSSPPGSTSSTVPIAELVKEAPRVIRHRSASRTPATGGRGDQQQRMMAQPKVGLRRFFFGDSPQPRRPFRPHHPHHPLPSPILPPPPFPPPPDHSSPLSAIRAGRSMLARRNSAGPPLFSSGITPTSHSSRTVSVDFDSESSGTTPAPPAEEITKRHKCNSSPNKAKLNGASRQNRMELPMGTARQHNGQQQQQQFNGAQFDTQSLQSRRSRSIIGTPHPNHTNLPNGIHHHHPHHHVPPPIPNGQPPAAEVVRCGSCNNLSVLNGGAASAAGPLVLYDGAAGNCSPTTAHRHSMALMEAQMPPIWFQPVLPPPPPFYYSAATLPHPAPPPPPIMDLATFRRALKETERLEKKQRKAAMADGEQGLPGACWDFCCGGSALILWLVITLIALGFLGFLLLAIYFL